VCSIVPLAKFSVDILTYDNRSEMAEIISNSLLFNNSNSWCNNVDASRSSRINEIIKIINKEKKKIIVFTSFSSISKVLEYYISKEITNRDVLRLSSSYNITQREELISNFNNTADAILILTYKLGSEGLNLQTCDTIIMSDYEWDLLTTQQAISRIRRRGQLSSVINIYHFSSELAIERVIFYKQIEKKKIYDDLLSGSSIKSIPQLTLSEIVEICSIEDNVTLLQKTIATNQ
jgi:SNF2 family DNA or RNA helicase